MPSGIRVMLYESTSNCAHWSQAKDWKWMRILLRERPFLKLGPELVEPHSRGELENPYFVYLLVCFGDL